MVFGQKNNKLRRKGDVNSRILFIFRIFVKSTILGLRHNCRIRPLCPFTKGGFYISASDISGSLPRTRFLSSHHRNDPICCTVVWSFRDHPKIRYSYRWHGIRSSALLCLCCTFFVEFILFFIFRKPNRDPPTLRKQNK